MVVLALDAVKGFVALCRGSARVDASGGTK